MYHNITRIGFHDHLYALDLVTTVEQDMLQKEVSRLQNLYQQQQQQQMHSKRHQINSTNLDSHTSITPKEAGS